MGIFKVFKSKDYETMIELDLIEEASNKVSLKRLAIQSVIGKIARTVMQSEFRVKKDGKYVKDEIYYRFNLRPNKNQSASPFWEQVVHKLLYDGECLVIKSDTDDLLVADSYTHKEYAVMGDSFSDVRVKDYEFKRTFLRSEVMFFEYGNEKLSSLIDGLYGDYGELLGRLIDFQKRKNQIRAVVDIEAVGPPDPKAKERIQKFINKTYKSIFENAVAIIPQQKGFKYSEESKNTVGMQSVDEINKVTDGFMNLVANAVSLPIGLLHGDLADTEKITKNYMMFCIAPIIKIIKDEANLQFTGKKEYLQGDKIDVRPLSYRDIFDVAGAADKLRGSSIANGHELRDALGFEPSDDPIHAAFFITKNYQDSEEALEGGETKNE